MRGPSVVCDPVEAKQALSTGSSIVRRPAGADSWLAPLHPALALEEPQQEDARGDDAADAEHEERPRRRDPGCHTASTKLSPKNPVMNDSGSKIVPTIASCFITSFRRLLTVERYRSVAPESRSR